MLLPISDDDRHLTRFAYVTAALIVINVLVFVFLQQLGAEGNAFTAGFSVIPYEVVNGIDLVTPQTINIQGQQVSIPQAPGPAPIYLTILTAMFMHGGLMHLGGNMLYLWIFGDNIEERFGIPIFLLLYFGTGIAATFAQIVLNPDGVIPNLGASGAISGILGAYLVLFPKNKVRALFFYQMVTIPAMLALGVWIGLQLFQGMGSLGATGGGVAYGAHIGGFIAGALAAMVLKRIIPDEQLVDKRATTRTFSRQKRRRS